MTVIDPSSLRYSSRLDLEWAHLRTSRRSLATARRWAAADPDHPLAVVAATATDLAEIVAATHRRTDGLDDVIVLRLVELARTDELAGRLLVQRLLPGLVRRSAAYRSYGTDVDPVEQAVAAAWLAIRDFDTERRRRHVAASLLSDAVFQAFRRPARRQSRTREVALDQPVEPAAPPEQPSAIEELAAVVRDARAAGVDDRDLDLVCDLVRTGSSIVVARERGVTARTIRNHRTRAVAAIREVLSFAA